MVPGAPRARNACPGSLIFLKQPNYEPSYMIYTPTWITIPAGVFTMGSDPRAAAPPFANEQPQQRIWLPEFIGSAVCIFGAGYTWYYFERLDQFVYQVAGIIAIALFITFLLLRKKYDFGGTWMNLIKKWAPFWLSFFPAFITYFFVCGSVSALAFISYSAVVGKENFNRDNFLLMEKGNNNCK